MTYLQTQNPRAMELKRTNSNELNETLLFSEARRMTSYTQSSLVQKEARRKKRPPLSFPRHGSVTDPNLEDVRETPTIHLSTEKTLEPLYYQPLLLIQANARMWVYSRYYQRIQKNALKIQAFTRGCWTRGKLEHIVLNEIHLPRIELAYRWELQQIAQERENCIRELVRAGFSKNMRAAREENETYDDMQDLIDELKAEGKQLKKEQKKLLKRNVQEAQQQEQRIQMQEELSDNLAQIQEYVDSLEQEVQDIQFVADTLENMVEEMTLNCELEKMKGEVEHKIRLAHQEKLDKILEEGKDYCGIEYNSDNGSATKGASDKALKKKRSKRRLTAEKKVEPTKSDTV